MRLLIFLIIALTFYSCESFENNGLSYSGDEKFTRACIDGVEYLIRSAKGSYRGYMAPHFKPNGTLYTCK